MLLLIGDIGGTKTILRLVEVAEQVQSIETIQQANYRGTKTILRLVEIAEQVQSFETIQQANYSSSSFCDLVPMVKEFLARVESKAPQRACFAIAGPVINNSSTLTNLNWHLDSKRLEQELNLEKVDLINDFAANSYGVLALKESDLYPLQIGQSQPSSPIAVIGAGTGLGEGFLIPQGRFYQVFATEGGHTDFAPRNDLEMQLLQYLQHKLNTEHISVERVVSGQGIVAIYQFLRDSNYAAESPEISAKILNWEQQKSPKIDPAAIISQGARVSGDRLCQKTMAMFVEAYGAEVGNVALKLLPYGGIYLTGGVAIKNLEIMSDGRFLASFKQKGRVSFLLENIPINLVNNVQVGLLGSILYALQFV
ncbi:glucokinase [Stanieria cyanosphaera PCC 7437]|uniref:Glucokinase n=2 Tax=Stanieria cyanosphaera TaxID=102116 RepID=K9XSA2_STAC7|nr:glucokinase [Stanieria cyanosphaera]AFZ34547.1 glucokinase [Stanieria cyanosphaera PCC 7437]